MKYRSTSFGFVGLIVSGVFFLMGCAKDPTLQKDEPLQNIDMPDFQFKRVALEDDGPWFRIQPNSRGIQSAYVRRQLIRLFDGEFALLEDEAGRERIPIDPVHIGTERGLLWANCFSYYEWNAQPEWDRFFRAIEDWRQAHPESPHSHIAQAWGLSSLAWSIRGTGRASSVSAEDSQRFFEKQREALNSLELAADKGGDHLLPWAVLRMRLARGLEEPKDQTKELARQLLELHPESPTLYAQWLVYLLPRWHGQSGEWQDWLEKEKRSEHWGPEGMSDRLYARTLWEVYKMIGNSDGLFFGNDQLDWPKTLRGLDQLSHMDTPDLPYWQTARVNLSFGTNDRGMITQAIDQMEDIFDSWVIGSEGWLRITREY